jgi:hypothetical protein
MQGSRASVANTLLAKLDVDEEARHQLVTILSLARRATDPGKFGVQANFAKSFSSLCTAAEGCNGVLDDLWVLATTMAGDQPCCLL